MAALAAAANDGTRRPCRARGAALRVEERRSIESAGSTRPRSGPSSRLRLAGRRRARARVSRRRSWPRAPGNTDMPVGRSRGFAEVAGCAAVLPAPDPLTGGFCRVRGFRAVPAAHGPGNWRPCGCRSALASRGAAAACRPSARHRPPPTMGEFWGALAFISPHEIPCDCRRRLTHQYPRRFRSARPPPDYTKYAIARFTPRRDSASILLATARVEARALALRVEERPDRLRSRTRGCSSAFSDSRRRLA